VKETPYSSVTTKLKGVSFTNLTMKNGVFPLYGGPHVWDEADYVVPPEVINIFQYLLIFCNNIIIEGLHVRIMPVYTNKFCSTILVRLWL